METVLLCDEDKAKILSGNVQRLLAVTTAWSRSFTRRVRSTASEPESFCADGAPWERTCMSIPASSISLMRTSPRSSRRLRSR